MKKNQIRSSPKSESKQNDDSEKAKSAISLLHQRISEKEANIQKLMTEIANIHNDIESKKLGFDAKVQRKREEMKNSYKSMIEELQSNVAMQLAENEALTSKIAEVTNQINDIVNAPIDIKPVKLNFDFSKNTEKLLKEREKEIRSQCSKEFYPFFVRLQEEHNETIESLEIEHDNEIKAIREAAYEELKKFKPRVFISQEEIAARQNFEKTQAKRNAEYESKRDKLLKDISDIEQDRDYKLSIVFAETKNKLQNEKSNFSKRRKMAKENVKAAKNTIPEPVTIPKLSPEDEEKLRKSAEQRLKSEFEQKLQTEVNLVQERREQMVKDLQELEKNEIQAANEENELTIFNLDNEISDLDEQMANLSKEYENYKSLYDAGNVDRSTNEDSLSQERGEKLYYMDKLRELESKLSKYAFEEEEEENPEVVSLQNELEAFANEINKEKRIHAKMINNLISQHESMKEKITTRANDLIQIKDETIAQLKQKIKETKQKIKEIHSEVSNIVH